MDLGIAGRTALLCASTRGLGRACAEALAAEGVHLVLNGRYPDRLEQVVGEIRAAYGVSVRGVVADVGSPEGRAALIAACPDPDILLNNTGGPAVGPVLKMGEAEFLGAIKDVMLSAISLTQAVLPGMVERRFGRIVNVTSGQVTAPRSDMALSAGPRAGLTAVMKGLSVDVARHNVTINNMMPERFATDRQREHARAQAAPRGITVEEAMAERAQGVAAKRMGDPAEFGATFAFLCSVHAGYLTGQNLHMDGGSYPGLV